MFAIINGKVILDNEIKQKAIIVDGQRIKEITDRVRSGIEVVDAGGYYVSPGFINIHVHGYNGHDAMEGSFEAINSISSSIVNTGVTGFLATTMTQSTDSIKKAVGNIYNSIQRVNGAKILGINLEGPFLNEKKKGAHPAEYIIKPSVENFKELCGQYEAVVKIVTIAPEVEGATELIEYLISKGIKVSIGHTNSTYDEAQKAIENGVTHSTHTFNAMTGFGHREPGTVGAILDSNVTAEFIPDGIHVHFAALRSLVKVKGTDKAVIITDSMCAAGLGDGDFELGGQHVIVRDKVAMMPDGTLAGSTISMNKGVYNTINHLNVPIAEAVKMASKNPAEAIGAKDLGEIKAGNYADLIFFNDNIDIKKMFINGQKII